MKTLAIFSLFITFVTASSFAADGILGDLHKKMSYLNNRQSVLSQNIANSDTPKYKSRDLAPLKFGSKNRRSRVRLATTSPSHIGGIGRSKGFRSLRDKNPSDTSLNGNNVVLDEQMLKMSETDLEYRATVGILRQMTTLVKSSIGDSR